METIILFMAGALFGAVLVLIVDTLREKEARDVARELMSEVERQKIQDLEVLIGKIRDSFGALSLEALSKNSDEFLKLAAETLSTQTQSGEKELEGKKLLIDRSLDTMKGDLENVRCLVQTLEKDREQKFGELSSQLRHTSEETRKLQETAAQLKTALASTRVRGQWGERMAEDVLRLAGFIEGINYTKQTTLETAHSRPDYTFLLPHDLKVNMDVKFPLDNYLRYLESDGDAERNTLRTRFLRDVRNRIKEVTSRDYINPEEKTVDYVMVFIPNEHVYAFINEHDRALMDDALKHKVILCSPITLYAILAVIRQAVDNFNLEKTAAEIMMLLGTFQKQWEGFVASMEKMGKRIDDVQREFNHLTTTRRIQLERPLRRIEDLRTPQGVSELHREGDQPLEIDVAHDR